MTVILRFHEGCVSTEVPEPRIRRAFRRQFRNESVDTILERVQEALEVADQVGINADVALRVREAMSSLDNLRNPKVLTDFAGAIDSLADAFDDHDRIVVSRSLREIASFVQSGVMRRAELEPVMGM